MNLYPTDHTSLSLEEVYCSIRDNGFSEYTLQLIDSYTNYILNGKTNLTQFNQQEHAGLCLAGEALIGAYIVCNYARASLEAGSDVGTCKTNPPNCSFVITSLFVRFVTECNTFNDIFVLNLTLIF